MHNESTASTLWCPMGRVGHLDAMTLNDPLTQYRVQCQGSQCAMWRWSDPHHNPQDPAREGYCGLAGKPEGKF